MSGRVYALSIACAGLLVGCGGGKGGGGNQPPANTAPNMAAQTFNGTEDTVLTGQVAAADPGDSLAFTAVTGPTRGNVTVTAAGAFTYTPNANVNGNDTFSVRVTDSRGLTATATMTVALAPVNDAPVAANDVLTVTSPLALDVLANDVDVDGEPLTVTLTGQAFAGTAVVNAGNTVGVVFSPSFKGFTKFTYRITDAAGAASEATALVFVGIQPFKVAHFRSSTDPQVHGFYVHDLFGERRVTEAGAPGINNFDGVRFAPGGGSLVYRGTGLPASNYVLRYVDLNDPAAQTRAVNDPALPVQVGAFVISRNGRYVAYEVSQNGVGSWIELFDAQAPGYGTRLNPAGQFAAGQLQFNDAGTFLYFSGCLLDAGIGQCTVHRASMASRVVERVAPWVAEVSSTLLRPVTRDDDRVFYRSTITHNNAPWEFPLLMSRVGQPDTAVAIGGLQSDEWSDYPIGVVPDGSRILMSIVTNITGARRTVLASTVDTNDVQVLAGPAFFDGDIALPGGLRPDSQAILYRRSDNGITQMYESVVGNLGAATPIGAPVTVQNSTYWSGQYSADGERMIYLREETLPAPFRRVVEVTRRDQPLATIHVTPNDGVAYLFELDPSGRVVAAAMRAGDSVRMELVNVDWGLVPLDLGETSALYQGHAVLPR